MRLFIILFIILVFSIIGGSWLSQEYDFEDDTSTNAELEKPRAQTPVIPLEPTPPQANQINFAVFFASERYRFETTAQFKERRQQILEEFNQAVQKRDRHYQAGIAYLTSYDANSETLFVSIKQQAAWLKQFLEVHPKQGRIQIAPNDVQTLWQGGTEKPFFITVELVGNNYNVTSGILIEGGKTWTVSLNRYIDNGNGTITDYQTGLIWLKNANCFGFKTWYQAKKLVAKMADGQCGLSDDSKRGIWRLPTKEELVTMVDNRYSNPTLSNAVGTGRWQEGEAFLGVKSSYYWSSSTTGAYSKSSAWGVDFYHGMVYYYYKLLSYHIWPVRGEY